jgi:hypothetical protein
MNAFDPTTHTYTIDGNLVPSVTTVLRDVLPGWQASEWHMQRGSAVHACAQMIANGVDFDHDEQIAGHVKAIRQFFIQVSPKVCEVELQVYSKRHGYAGTLDLTAFIGAGKQCHVIDYKATLTDQVPYQAAAYAIAYEEETGAVINRGLGVEIRANGTYQLSKVYDLKTYKQGWLALLTTYRIRRQCGVKAEGTDGGVA